MKYLIFGKPIEFGNTEQIAVIKEYERLMAVVEWRKAIYKKDATGKGGMAWHEWQNAKKYAKKHKKHNFTIITTPICPTPFGD